MYFFGLHIKSLVEPYENSVVYQLFMINQMMCVV